MNLGFHYHVAVYSTPEGIIVPAYLGLFLDDLAKEVDILTLFMHEANNWEKEQCDYSLKGQNIRYVTLGLKKSAWVRFLWPYHFLKNIYSNVGMCDSILVRAPSPFAPAFGNYFNKIARVTYLVVGDYAESSRQTNQPLWRKIPIMVLNYRNDNQLKKVLKKCPTVVNSRELFLKYSGKVKELYEIKTSTLTNTDFFERKDTCQGNEIKLLYTGRIDLAKGLLELIEATGLLRTGGTNVSLHFVGWENGTKKPIERKLKQRAEELGISDFVFFHGLKTAGIELNKMYQMADIFVIPSYHEGFPRAIWEAMANSLPVIATSVGSIPHYLVNREEVLLIKPKDANQLTGAISNVINDTNLRQKLLRNGFRISKEVTSEKQVKLLVDTLRLNK